MSEPRADTEVVLPEVPEAVAALPAHLAGLAIAAQADGGRFLVEGERTAVVGLQHGPVETIRIDGAVVAERVRHLSGVPVNIVTLPGVVRREWVGPTGMGLEAIVAARTLPLVAVQWTQPAAGAAGTASTGAATLTPTIASPGGTVVVELPPGDHAGAVVGASAVSLPTGDGRVVAYGVTPTPVGLSLVDDGTGGLRLEATGLPPGTTTLLVAHGGGAAVRSAFAAAAHLQGHAALAARSPAEDGLTLVTGIAAVDEAFQWARARVSAALARAEAGFGPEAAPLWGALAALGVGDAVAAARATRLVSRQDPVAGALLAARMCMSFGDTRAALAQAHALLAETDADALLPDPYGCLAPALTSLAEALRYAATGSFLTGLRRAATRLPAPAAAGSPTLGLGPWLAATFAGEPTSPEPEAPRAAPELALAARFRADPTGAWVAWRSALAAGMSSGPAGPGSWDPEGRGGAGSDGDGVTPVTAALLVAAAYGLLGIAPDAPSGRIRIAPRLADHLTAFRADGVTVGDSSISMTYERDGAVHRYTLEPTAASVPPTVVFEPSVAGAVSGTRLDGTDVELDVRRAGGRSVVPVQIPVDARRVLEIDGGP